MTVPVSHSPLQQTGDPLLWEAESEKNKAAAKQAAASNSVVTPYQAGSDMEGDTDAIREDILGRGEDRTQGVIAAEQTKKQRQQQNEEAEYRDKLQQSIQDLTDQANTFQDQLSDHYKQQAEEYNKKFQEWIDSNQTYVDPQGRIRSQSSIGEGTYLSGSEYTGQAAQIAQYAKQAGFPPNQIATAVAVALGESGGRADAYNGSNSNGTADHGLMQINSVHSGLLKNYNWKDPAQNMQMAYQIWRDAGGSWSPWVAYTNGSYKKFLDTGKSASKMVMQEQLSKPNVSFNSEGQLRTTIVQTAKQYFGLPYQWGGDGPDDGDKGFDCSGLVQQVYGDLGIQLPRTANAQSTMGKTVSISQLQPGDLVAWRGGWKGPNPSAAQRDPSYVGHIAIYAGNGKIIESSGPGVRTRTLGVGENIFGVKLSFTGK